MIVVGQQFSQNLRALELIAAAIAPIETNPEPETRNQNIGLFWEVTSRYKMCFTTKDGLINYDVWSILEDRAGNLWVGTRNTGLCRFDGKTFTSFSE